MNEVTPMRRETAPLLEHGADILLNASELPQMEIIRQAQEAALAAASPSENLAPVTDIEKITIVSEQTLRNRRWEVDQYRQAA